MNILLTCAGRRNYMVDYFSAALKQYGGKVFASNSTIHSSALIAADRGFIVPKLYDPDYIDVLISLCKEFAIQAVVPLFDLELPILAQAKERFLEENIRTVVSNLETVKICNDKLATYRFLVQNGFSTPRSYFSLDEAISALDNGEVDYPVIVKPRWGMGSIGVQQADDEQELTTLIKKVKNVIEHTYLATESKHDTPNNVVIQQRIEGIEYGLDVINDLKGQYAVTFVKQKIAMRSGETDGATTVDDPQLRELGARLSKALRHIGNLDVDVFKSGDQIFVLELNPRFGGGYPFSHLAGANVPAAIIAWLHDQIPQPEWLQIRYGVTGYKGLQMMQLGDLPDCRP